jgi:biopolymer transport protein ExbD
MAVRIKRGTAMQQLPVVPLVDTVLNLLIFFLVATKFAEVEREMALQLPEAGAAQPASMKAETFIDIDADGHYYHRGQQVALPELDRHLQAEWVNNPHVSAIIRADARCRWQAVIAAMNACNKNKIRDYRVSTGNAREGPG